MHGTYPTPRYPALLHTVTSLHGAPPVEDTLFRGAASSARRRDGFAGNSILQIRDIYIYIYIHTGRMHDLGRDCFLGASFVVVVVATFDECLEWGVLCRWDVSRGGS